MKNRVSINQLVLFFLVFLISAKLIAEDYEYDPQVGEEINEVCAGCHGEFAQGGKQGKYPRLAGLPYEFLVEQIKRFQDRSRPNMPMVEHVEERQLPDRDIFDISRYLSEMKLATRLPPIDESAPDFDAYQRLLDADKIIQIPRSKGDIKAGEKMYKKECRSCHGRAGEGDNKDAVPMLAGQYTEYLWRQVDLYIKGVRVHDKDDPDEELLADFTKEELRDIFAYVSILDD
jgi:cytochrome c553